MGLFISSLEKQIPVEIMYMNNKGVITDRLIIVMGDRGEIYPCLLLNKKAA
ncbi:hypothetical protein [Peribacillus huizhouensis]|uniref:Uncharacterized protein n=1 Tax=Peribacillus huizhouensis TaxID=1501239 RepID=A0ABR6CK64_9BACI|nr:hypothetical protein [Peribacillus huizhouensis]MBA9024747.1 hypothetical protein [Peribacillus huizhouensis]